MEFEILDSLICCTFNAQQILFPCHVPKYKNKRDMRKVANYWYFRTSIESISFVFDKIVYLRYPKLEVFGPLIGCALDA